MQVSIAMATYNGEQFLREQLDSILHQTIQDFEVVVCDDYSTDSTWQILQEYKSNDSRVHCCQNEQNLGFVKNFERAISLCKGDYIALSDQDDIWTENHLQTLLENIGDNMACCGDAILIENGMLTNKLSVRLGHVSDLSNYEAKLKRIVYGGNPYQGASMLINTKFLNKILPISQFRLHDVWIAHCSCVHNSFMYIDKVITQYRQHSSNASSGRKKHSQWWYFFNLNTKKYKTNGYLSYCEELLLRFPNMDEMHKATLLKARQWFQNVPNRWYRFKNIHFWIKIYPYLFPGQSRRLLIPKLIRFLFI